VEEMFYTTPRELMLALLVFPSSHPFGDQACLQPSAATPDLLKCITTEPTFGAMFVEVREHFNKPNVGLTYSHIDIARKL